MAPLDLRSPGAIFVMHPGKSLKNKHLALHMSNVFGLPTIHTIVAITAMEKIKQRVPVKNRFVHFQPVCPLRGEKNWNNCFSPPSRLIQFSRFLDHWIPRTKYCWTMYIILNVKFL